MGNSDVFGKKIQGTEADHALRYLDTFGAVFPSPAEYFSCLSTGDFPIELAEHDCEIRSELHGGIRLDSDFPEGLESRSKCGGTCGGH